MVKRNKRKPAVSLGGWFPEINNYKGLTVQEQDSKASWLVTWLKANSDTCWNCSKKFKPKNPPFWHHLKKITDDKAFTSICTSCTTRQLLSSHNIKYYLKKHPEWVALAKKLKLKGK